MKVSVLVSVATIVQVPADHQVVDPGQHHGWKGFGA
jgi:hypothetical protein